MMSWHCRMQHRDEPANQHHMCHPTSLKGTQWNTTTHPLPPYQLLVGFGRIPRPVLRTSGRDASPQSPRGYATDTCWGGVAISEYCSWPTFNTSVVVGNSLLSCVLSPLVDSIRLSNNDCLHLQMLVSWVRSSNASSIFVPRATTGSKWPRKKCDVIGHTPSILPLLGHIACSA